MLILKVLGLVLLAVIVGGFLGLCLVEYTISNALRRVYGKND